MFTRFPRQHTGIILILLTLLGYAFPVSAQTTVGDGSPASCTTANLVSALAGGGLIDFNCGGAATITLSETLLVQTNTTIDGGGVITLSGDGARRILQHTAGTLTLQNLTLTAGFASGEGTAANGAAVRSIFQGTPPTLNIDNVTFTNNISSLTSAPTGDEYDFGGGAIYTQGGFLTIEDSTFTNNSADNGAGGAIHGLRSNVSITASDFTSNSAIGDGQGGAAYFDGAQTSNGLIEIHDSDFTNNSTHNQGGAIYVHLYQGNDEFNVYDTAFVNNAVIGGDRGLGGAISGGNGRVNIIRSLFSSNDVARDDGGGGYFDGSGGALAFAETARINIANSTFTGNRAEGVSFNANGGAIYIVNNSPAFTIINSTIVNNFAGWVGGGISSTTSGILRNTIVANNIADNGLNGWDIQQQCSAQLINGGNNIQFPDRNPDPNFFNEVICAPNITIAEPLLNNLADNGGPTLTMLPQFGSPVVDSGNDVYCNSSPISHIDQRSFTRPTDGNGNGTRTCDIGATEYYADIPPFAAVLISPLNGINITDSTPQFLWQTAPFADTYRLQVDDEIGFASPMINVPLTGDRFTPNILLPGDYYWRVVSENSFGSTLSQPRTITITSPLNAAPLRNLYTAQPVLTWGSLDWAIGYEIQIASDAKFRTVVFELVTDIDTLTATTDDLPNAIYYWRVRAQQENGKWGKWSAAETFTLVVP